MLGTDERFCIVSLYVPGSRSVKALGLKENLESELILQGKGKLKVME